MRSIRIAALILVGCASWPAAGGAEESAVLGVIERLFRAMAARDEAALRAVMLPEGRYLVVRADGIVSSGTNAEFIARVTASEDTLWERIWAPQVMVRPGTASVWAPYDFHRNGKFSHCGVDSFHLLKTPTGWKIAGLSYTVEPTGCAVRGPG